MHPSTQRSERLKNERKRLGWSQQKAADAIGVRREMWAKYEAGAEPGADALSNMQKAGIDVDYVLTGVTEAESLRQRDALHEAGGVSKAQRAAHKAEVELLANYRSCPPEIQVALRKMAAHSASREPGDES
jgi:transcriptional regulator with XRE-family HTH domain